MLYLFTGNNRYLILEEVQSWKKAFIEKHGEENISYIFTQENQSSSLISESLTSRSLFAEKRLVFIDGFPFSGDSENKGSHDIESAIIENINNIPEETIVVCISVSPDKRKSAYKSLSKLAKIKNFEVSSDDVVEEILRKKYGTIIEREALKRLILIKGGKLEKCISEIEKLSIIHSEITTSHIAEIIIPEFEESIFTFIDTILSRNSKKIFSELENLLNFSNLYAIYQSIIANIRVFLYIEYLKNKKISPNEISDILKLGKRSFLIQKSHRSSYESIQNLYKSLLEFDKNMKFGKFASSDEADLKRELEKIFLKFIV